MRVRLAKINRDEVLHVAKTGGWLNLQELAVAMHFDYDVVREWKQQGLPLVYGRIKLADAEAWLKSTFLAVPKQPSGVEVAVQPSTFRLKYL